MGLLNIGELTSRATLSRVSLNYPLPKSVEVCTEAVGYFLAAASASFRKTRLASAFIYGP